MRLLLVALAIFILGVAALIMTGALDRGQIDESIEAGKYGTELDTSAGKQRFEVETGGRSASPPPSDDNAP